MMKNEPYDAEPGLWQYPGLIIQTGVHRAKLGLFVRTQGGLVYTQSILDTKTL